MAIVKRAKAKPQPRGSREPVSYDVKRLDRLTDSSGELLGEMGPGETQEEELRLRYGPGIYLLEGRNELGRFVSGQKFKVIVSAMPDPVGREPQPASTGAPVIDDDDELESGLIDPGELREVIREELREELRDALREFRQPQPVANPQPQQPVAVPSPSQSLRESVGLLKELMSAQREMMPPAPPQLVQQQGGGIGDLLVRLLSKRGRDPEDAILDAIAGRGRAGAEGDDRDLGWFDVAIEAIDKMGPDVAPGLSSLLTALADRVKPISSPSAQQQPGATTAPGDQQQPPQGASGAGQPQGDPNTQQAAEFVQNLPMRIQIALGQAVNSLLEALGNNTSPEEFGQKLREQCANDEDLKALFTGILDVPTEQLLESVRQTPGGAGAAAHDFALDWLAKMQAAFFGPDEQGGKAA